MYCHIEWLTNVNTLPTGVTNEPCLRWFLTTWMILKNSCLSRKNENNSEDAFGHGLENDGFRLRTLHAMGKHIIPSQDNIITEKNIPSLDKSVPSTIYLLSMGVQVCNWDLYRMAEKALLLRHLNTRSRQQNDYYIHMHVEMIGLRRKSNGRLYGSTLFVPRATVTKKTISGKTSVLSSFFIRRMGSDDHGKFVLKDGLITGEFYSSVNDADNKRFSAAYMSKDQARTSMLWYILLTN